LIARRPEISCVVPAFEQPALLERCLRSIAAQRDVAAEIIVTDDSRFPAVAERVAALAIDGVRYLDGARRGNPVDNWNFGLAQAEGDACVLVHQDEFLIDPTYLRRAVDRLDDSGIAAVIARTTVIGVNRRSHFALASRIGRVAGRPAWILPTLNWIGPTAAFVFRKGPLFDPALVQLVDVDFYRRVLATGRAAMLEGACVGSLGHHAAQITASINPRQAARGEIAHLAKGAELSFHRAVLGLRAWTR
jgi:glycosyltransferase involved in cell wall biosynthesis